MSMKNELIERLGNEVVDYLGQNPEAADGIEGITRWWLSHDLPGKTRESVRAALALLEKKGLVTRTALRDGTEVYARGPAGPPGQESGDR
jgi:Fe2+ or Zn2+ uptake regulation protein